MVLSFSSLESDDFVPDASQIIHERYQIISLLGSGAYSAVWKCCDIKTSAIIALKVHKLDSECTRAGKLEASILRNMTHLNILKALDSFTYYDNMPTSNKYFCVVYELCDGDLEQYMDRFDGAVPLDMVKSIVQQTLQGLSKLHSQNIMHLDIKPENILYCEMDCDTTSNIEAAVFKLADFGSAEYTVVSDSGIVGTRYYRAPEIILGLNHSTASDIWSVGCLLFELCTGDILFEPHNYRNFDITRDEDHLAMISELMGPYPKWMMSGYRRKKYLHKNGMPRHIGELYIWPLSNVLLKYYKIFDNSLLHLLESMLAIDPHRRPTAIECLSHEWFASSNKN